MSSSVASAVKQKGYINIHTKSEPVPFFMGSIIYQCIPFSLLGLAACASSASVW